MTELSISVHAHILDIPAEDWDGTGAGEPADTASDGLGESTAGDAFGAAPETPAKGGRRRAAQPAEPETV